MVTATVQCKRQQQEQNKATETLMCCKHTPLLKELCEPHLQALGAKALPGAPSRALQSASAPAAVGCSQHCVAPSAPNAGTQHPTVPHPCRPQGQVSPEAISCAIQTTRGKGRKGQRPETLQWRASPGPIPPFPAPATPGQRETCPIYTARK